MKYETAARIRNSAEQSFAMPEADPASPVNPEIPDTAAARKNVSDHQPMTGGYPPRGEGGSGHTLHVH